MRGIAGPTSNPPSGRVRLFERERELAAFDAAFDAAAAGHGSLLVVDGPAGLGKSSLLTAACERADARGLRVLRARGDTLAAEHPWSVATQLFGEVPRSPGGPQVAHDPFPLVHGLYRATVNLAERTPLLVTIDDAHWCDPHTLRFVHYLCGRLDALGVVVLVAHRTGEPTVEAVDAQLRQLAAAPAAQLHTLRPLGAASVDALVAEVAPATADACRSAIFEAAGGNPFLTRELVRTALADALPLDRPAAAEVLRASRPATIRAAIGARLTALGPEAVHVADAVALLGPWATTPLVTDLTGRPADQVRATIDRLVAGGLLAHPGPLGGTEPIRFVHPVVREVVYGELGPARTAHGHLRCAELLVAHGAAAGEVADHLLRAEPCHAAWVIDQLAAAAEEARARRAPERAVAVLRRALELCRDPGRADELTMRLTTAELGAGDAGGHRRVATVVAALPRLAGRVEPVPLGEFALALYAHGRFTEARAAFGAALAGAPPSDPVVEATLVAGLEMAGLLAADPSDRARRRLDRVLVEGHDDLTLANRVLAALAAGHLALGVDLGAPTTGGARGRPRVLELLRRADPRTLPPSLGPTVLEPVAIALWLCDELTAAAELLDPAIEAATRDGELVSYSSLLPLRALVALAAGDLGAARADATTAIRLSAEWSAPNAIARGPAEHALVSAVLETDDPSDATFDALHRATCGDAPDGRPVSPIDGWHLHARGRLALAEGRPADALDLLLQAGDRFRSAGGPGAYCEWRVWAAAAAQALGARHQAERLATDELAWAEAFGAPRAISRALRCASRTTGRDDAVELLGRAVETAAGSPARLERAHAHIDLGAALRRAGRRVLAREHLRLGIDEAQRCGATGLVRRGIDELERSGARRVAPRAGGVAALTPSETRVAELAAAGRTNPEIAAAMFVSRKTVEVHLTSVYRKLGIGGRTELAGALGAPATS